jgi:radical SAM protein with 4Fe4S-binding SPASM domain
MDLKKSSVYKLSDSFNCLSSKKESSLVNVQRNMAIKIIQKAIKEGTLEKEYSDVIRSVLEDLKNLQEKGQYGFQITTYEAEEMENLTNDQIIRYLFHRYRYLIYPIKKILDNYPPCLQIEPASICNFRCRFCYQSDQSFNRKSSGFMGTMTLERFKKIIDQIENHVEFVTLASRGEPLLAGDFIPMIEYTKGKFLGLKINTNASVLTEKHIHAILSSEVQTLVISADATEEPLYSQFRVNGNLKKILRNVERLHDIREKYYPDAKTITRVSGVMIDPEKQDIDSMRSFWGSLVDQVSFVKYSPWEKIYQADPNSISTSCSDLWRRMFVWYDGKVSPCDNDYKSTVKIGSIDETTISELWKSQRYQDLRGQHLNADRCLLDPCKRCTVT